MEVTVKLFASLRIDREKEMIMDLPTGATTLDIIEKLDIPKEDVAIIMINGRGKTLETVIVENDTVSLFPPVGGG